MKKHYSLCVLANLLAMGLSFAVLAQEEVVIGIRALLPKGAILTRLADDKKLVISKETYVNVLGNRLQKEDSFTVIGKKGEPLYMVTPDQVTLVEGVSDLFDPPISYSEYGPPVEKKKDVLGVSQEFSLAFYRLGSGFLNNIEGRGGEDISGVNLFYQGLLDINSIVSLGGEINYSTGTSGDAEGKVKVQRLSLGPIVSKALIDFDRGGKISLQVGTLRSIFFDVKDVKSQGGFPFSSQSFKVGIQLHAPGAFADFTFGVQLSREFISPVIGEFPEEIETQEARETQVALMTGVTW